MGHSFRPHNAERTCWNCPCIDFKGLVDFRACGQSMKAVVQGMGGGGETQMMVECKRRPDMGAFDPASGTFEDCPEWINTPFGYMLRDMRVMILGIDGYLGWTLAIWLGSLGFKVSGIDNFNRRKWSREEGSHSVVPIPSMTKRLRAAREMLGIDITFREIDILDRARLAEFIEEVKPEAIVHYAECPSAPYSMVDAEHAIHVQHNNVIGTLGLLFLMRDLAPESSLIKLGTMGEYGSPLTGRPLFEGIFPADAVLQWGDRVWSLGGEITPRDPVSFYHVSKVQDTFNVYEACKYWWLRSYDIMQGVIYGVHTDQIAADRALRTRFDIDEWFGTVINRFVAQAVVGIPLTIYGSGGQTRGYIALRDAMQCMTRIICSPPEPGQYDVVNQISGVYTVTDLAETVARIGSEEFNLPVKIQRLENPRVEADEHPYEALYEKLPRQLGFEPTVSLEEEVYEIFRLLTQPEIKRRIEKKRHVIFPRTRWSGLKQAMDVLETYDLQQGRKRHMLRAAS